MPREVVPIFHPAGSVFRAQFHHAMVGKNNLCAVRDEKIAVHFHAGSAQRGNFLQKGQRVNHHAIADDAGALRPQNAAGDELQNKFFSVDDDGVSGVVSAGVARHDRKSLREYVDNFALALVAPLGSNNDRGSASALLSAATQCETPIGILRGRKPAAPGSHTLTAPVLLNRLEN